MSVLFLASFARFSIFIFLSLSLSFPSFILHAFYPLVMIEQGDVENKPTAEWDALDGQCIVLRNDAFSSRRKSYAPTTTTCSARY